MNEAPGLIPASPTLIATVIVRSQSLLQTGGEPDVDSIGGWRMEDVSVEHKKRGDDTSSFCGMYWSARSRRTSDLLPVIRQLAD